MAFLVGGSLLFAACGGDDDDGGNPFQPDASSQQTDDDEGDTPTDADNGSSDDDDDNASMLEGFVNELEPPNSDEKVRFSAEEGLTVSWESEDSADDLEDFYDDKLRDLGFEVVSTMDGDDSHTWFIVADASTGAGGLVSVAPSGNGTMFVTVTLGSE